MSKPRKSTESSKSPNPRFPAAFTEFPYAALGRGRVLKPAIQGDLFGVEENRFPLLALPDSGADFSVFPMDYAEPLGIDIRNCKDRLVDTGNGKSVHHHWTKGLRAVVAGRELTLKPCFAKIGVAVLGREDFFAEFCVVVDEHQRLVTIWPHEH